MDKILQRLSVVSKRILEQCTEEPDDIEAFIDVLPSNIPCTLAGLTQCLEQLQHAAQKSPGAAQHAAYVLEDALEALAQNDFFGTERQCDPRGDGRNGQWSMDCVEGVD